MRDGSAAGIVEQVAALQRESLTAEHADGLSVEDIPQADGPDENFMFYPGDGYYMERFGQGPVTDIGRLDMSILDGLSKVSMLQAAREALSEFFKGAAA